MALASSMLTVSEDELAQPSFLAIFSDVSNITAALVKFRMIVFRPFKGEIILGKITSATEQGIKSEWKLYRIFFTFVVIDYMLITVPCQLALNFSTISMSLQIYCLMARSCEYMG